MEALTAGDEINIILLIKSLIDCKKTAVETIGEAGDGITALEMVCWLKPDVVITDIRMPGMGGTDLIRYVREEQIPVESVIISGYSESEYARSAIQCGVSDYLLKPIKKGKLNDILAKLESQRVGRREQQMQLNLTENRLVPNNGILRENLLQNLLTGGGKLSGQTLEAGKDKDILDFRGSCFIMVAVKLDCVSDFGYQVPEQAVETTTVKIVRRFKAYCHETEFTISRLWGHIYLNYGGGESALDHICPELGEMLERTEYKNDLFEVAVGIGSQVSSLEYLLDSLDTAMRSMMLRIDLGVGSIIYHDRLLENYKKDSYLLLKKFKVKMEYQAPLLVPGKLVFIGEEVMNRTMEGRYRYYGFYGLLEEMFERAGFVFSDIMEDYEIPDIEPYIRRLENCTTLNQLKQVWADYVSVSCGLCQRQKDGMGSRPARMIKEYIGEHYSGSITLSDVAGIVFLNPAYLSAIFKKETGQILTQYLIDVRIDKAKEMFRNPEKSIGETACLVGYQDERHFSKLFSKMTGVKLTEYRRSYI